LFFEQLPALEADLYVISLGTNESFDKQDIATYFGNLKTMIDGIKQKSPEASFLVTTPPPSVLHGKSQNIYIEKFELKSINKVRWHIQNAESRLQEEIKEERILKQ
jgi:hypothetical protein